MALYEASYDAKATANEGFQGSESSAAAFQNEYLILASTKPAKSEPTRNTGDANSAKSEPTKPVEAKDTKLEQQEKKSEKTVAKATENREEDKETFLSGWEQKLDKEARQKAEEYFAKLKPEEQTAILDYAKATRENPKKASEGWLDYAGRLKKEGSPNVDLAMKVMGKMAMQIVFFNSRYSLEQKKAFTE